MTDRHRTCGRIANVRKGGRGGRRTRQKKIKNDYSFLPKVTHHSIVRSVFFFVFFHACSDWGDNNPTITRDIVDFSAEIYEDPLYVPYREAVRAYLQTSLINENHDGGAESYLVEVMTLSDHYDRQNARRWKAWVCLLVSAACWPILVAMLHALLWLIKQVKDACAKDPQRMA